MASAAVSGVSGVVLLPVLALAVSASSVVHAPAGFFQGTVSSPLAGDGVEAFLGIPYAEPPIGARRFAAPTALQRPLGTADQPFDATSYGASCIQALLPPPFEKLNTPPPHAEDCLFLNIWTPSLNGSAPVMLWVHGGAWKTGSGRDVQWSGPVFTRSEGVILVTINYRLNVLGFGAPPGADETASVNGLLDQRLAMRWVQENIAAFGGDPKRVLLGGESAGAGSICMHLVMAGSRGLFGAAVMESALCDARSKTYGVLRGQAISDAVGCNGSATPAEELECVRQVNVSSDQWMNLICDPCVLGGGPWNFEPAAGNSELPVVPARVSAPDIWSRDMHVLMGYNSDEGALFPAFPSLEVSATKEDFRQALLTEYSPGLVNEILDVYAPDADSSPYGWYRASTRFAGDRQFKCPGLKVASVRAAAQWSTWFYHYDHRASCDFMPVFKGVVHGAEIPFVFGTPEFFALGGGCANFTAEEKKLNAAMMASWAALAAMGDPNMWAKEPAAISWPRLVADGAFEKLPVAHIVGPGADAVTEIGYRAAPCTLIFDKMPLPLSGLTYTPEEPASLAALATHRSSRMLLMLALVVYSASLRSFW